MRNLIEAVSGLVTGARRHMNRRRPVALRGAIGALGSAVMLMASPLQGQIRASELASLSQVIDGTKITVTYSRPRARGRWPLFGTPIAHWGETWTPGANFATVLEVSKDVTINGVPVPKGKYSMWMVLREQGDWTTVLDPNVRIFHMNPPDSLPTQRRIATPTATAPMLDALTFTMQDLTVNSGVLQMHWGTTKALLKVVMTPSLDHTLAEADARPYVGSYALKETQPASGTSGTSTFIVFYDKGTLKARFDPNDAYMQTFAMIRVAPDLFTPGIYDKDGTIYEVLRPDMMVAFKRTAGRPMQMEIRGLSDSLEATGVRKP